MSTAKRRINSTGRKRIGRECIEISMLETAPDEPLKAKVSLKLDNQNFPGDATVAVEAYHRSSGMRFDCGTVNALNVPDVLVLSEVDKSGSVLFRLKVVDNDAEPGKLLGSAERLKPKSEDDSDGRRSIFPILYSDLRHDVWKVEIEQGDRPVLVVNKRIPGFSHKLLESPMMQGLLLPAALRFVLKDLVRVSDTGEEDDEPGWKEEWLEYCRNELGAADDPRELPDEISKENWIDDVAMRFCENLSLVDRIRTAAEEH
ncbi:hypothetical protein NA8A_10143 [Nitratireductor indicus C115]|uniref:Uncharacterized protein n=1 Tax=Nitratireductor indicus C115 TaxID=1231190 RepID=K2NX20_9HYPH|nr:hypothetical protein [Nitratireductor indicus]EKF42414.1 hypothetical protein NA8A_10143 [Nitratireductor indicus C115]SFQ55747.1 hypothetical protein SAMN05216176_10660 [Nitratireductor indicus]